jgi:cobalamin biosynthesis protein CbiD
MLSCNALVQQGKVQLETLTTAAAAAAAAKMQQQQQQDARSVSLLVLVYEFLL